jgi:hypothetical protein
VGQPLFVMLGRRRLRHRSCRPVIGHLPPVFQILVLIMPDGVSRLLEALVGPVARVGVRPQLGESRRRHRPDRGNLGVLASPVAPQIPLLHVAVQVRVGHFVIAEGPLRRRALPHLGLADAGVPAHRRVLEYLLFRHCRRDVGVVPVVPPESRGARRPQRVGPGDVGRLGERDPVGGLVLDAQPAVRSVVSSHYRFQVEYFRRGDLRGVHERQGAIRRLQYLVVADYRRPLQRQPHVAPLALVEARVHAMLEIRRGRNLRFLLLLREHLDRSLSCRRKSQVGCYAPFQRFL